MCRCTLRTLTDGWPAPVSLNATGALSGSGHGREARVTDVHSNGARCRGGNLDLGVFDVRGRPAAQL